MDAINGFPCVSSLWNGVLSNDLAQIERGILSGDDVNARHSSSPVVPMMMAAFLGNEDAVRLIASAGGAYPDRTNGKAYVDFYQDGKYSSDLTYDAAECAVAHKNIEMFKLLLSLPGAKEKVDSSPVEKTLIWGAVQRAADGGDDRFIQVFALQLALWKSPRVHSEVEISLLRSAIFEFIPNMLSLKARYREGIRGLTFEFPEDYLAESDVGVEIRSIKFKINSNRTLDHFKSFDYGNNTSTLRRHHLADCDELTSISYSRYSPNLYIEMMQSVKEVTYFDNIGGHCSHHMSGTLFYADNPGALDRFSISRPPSEAQADLWLAIDSNRPDLARQAMVAGACSKLECLGRNYAEIEAARCGSGCVLRTLLECDDEVRKRIVSPDQSNGFSALTTAVAHIDRCEIFYPEDRIEQHREIALDLLALGVDANVVDRNGSSALLLACECSNVNVDGLILALLRANADYSGIHEAVRNGEYIHPRALDIIKSWQACEAVSGLLNKTENFPALR